MLLPARPTSRIDNVEKKGAVSGNAEAACNRSTNIGTGW